MVFDVIQIKTRTPEKKKKVKVLNLFTYENISYYEYQEMHLCTH